MELNKRNLERLGRLLRAAANEIRKLTQEPGPVSPYPERRAFLEQKIRRVMARCKRLTVTRLRDKTNYARFGGLQPWTAVLDAMVQAGELRVHEERASNGKLSRIVTLEKL